MAAFLVCVFFSWLAFMSINATHSSNISRHYVPACRRSLRISAGGAATSHQAAAGSGGCLHNEHTNDLQHFSLAFCSLIGGIIMMPPLRQRWRRWGVLVRVAGITCWRWMRRWFRFSVLHTSFQLERLLALSWAWVPPGDLGHQALHVSCCCCCWTLAFSL